MRILVTGASGLVGSALVPFLETGGHGVVRVVRRPTDVEGEVEWDPASGHIDSARIGTVDAAVHLAGENIASGRWSAARKARIRDSRVEGTALLARTLAGLEKPPRVLVCASAIGYYGSRGDEILTEDSEPGDDFLSEVCREWEAASAPALQAGIRVVFLRFGVILTRKGGALGKMLPVFKLGMGGKIGNGRQYMSWITLDDAAGAIGHALETDDLAGPVNAVAPNAVTNAEFTRALGQTLHRPTMLPLPAFAARIALGEMAEALLLASARVEPKRLEESGYEFRHRELGPALRAVLGK